MTKGVGDSLNRYTVTSDLQFDDLTIRRFTRGEAIRHSDFVICGFIKSRVSTEHPELTKIARHAAL
jgi:hypothetical protein